MISNKIIFCLVAILVVFSIVKAESELDNQQTIVVDDKTIELYGACDVVCSVVRKACNFVDGHWVGGPTCWIAKKTCGLVSC